MVKKETKIRAVQLEAVKRHSIVIILVPAVLLRIRQGGTGIREWVWAQLLVGCMGVCMAREPSEENRCIFYYETGKQVAGVARICHLCLDL